LLEYMSDLMEWISGWIVLKVALQPKTRDYGDLSQR
jgi:hypothetical protein